MNQSIIIYVTPFPDFYTDAVKTEESSLWQQFEMRAGDVREAAWCCRRKTVSCSRTNWRNRIGVTLDAKLANGKSSRRDHKSTQLTTTRARGYRATKLSHAGIRGRV